MVLTVEKFGMNGYGMLPVWNFVGKENSGSTVLQVPTFANFAIFVQMVFGVL